MSESTTGVLRPRPVQPRPYPVQHPIKGSVMAWLLRQTDAKQIGIMYMILGIVMLLRGFADALMMRLQQAMAFGGNEGYLNAHHYDQVFTAHGTIMIFFVAIPLISGVINFVMPLQIGARDVAFPFLNSLSLWLTPRAPCW